MMHGMIKPNGYPQHFHGDIHFVADAPREFIVDPSATRVVNEKGKPLILTEKAYAEIREKFGSVLVCEPVGAKDGEGAAERVSSLEAQLSDVTAQLTASEGDRAKFEQLSIDQAAMLAEALAEVEKLKAAVASAPRRK